MLIENIELTMSKVRLGFLDEYALLVLFGNAHSHHLVKGLEIKPNEITDSQNRILYPAYYKTHIKVPIESILSNYTLWDNVQIGIDVKRFGKHLLSSNYILGLEGEISDKIEEWDTTKYPSMEANNLMIIDPSFYHDQKRTASLPKNAFVENIEIDKYPPKAIRRARMVEEKGFKFEVEEHFSTSEPIRYQIDDINDTSPGHTILFAQFSRIMDFAEREVLTNLDKLAIEDFPIEALHILEREVYYYDNCFAGESLDISIRGVFNESYTDDINLKCDSTLCGTVDTIIEIVNSDTKKLVIKAAVKKALIVTSNSKKIIRSIMKLIHYYRNENRNLCDVYIKDDLISCK